MEDCFPGFGVGVAGKANALRNQNGAHYSLLPRAGNQGIVTTPAQLSTPLPPNKTPLEIPGSRPALAVCFALLGLFPLIFRVVGLLLSSCVSSIFLFVLLLFVFCGNSLSGRALPDEQLLLCTVRG